MKKKKPANKLSRFEWVKKNIVIVPVVAAILAGTFTSVRYVLSLTDTIEANKQTIINLSRDLTVAEDKLIIVCLLASLVAKHTQPVSYTHLRAHETDSYLVCRLLL